MLSITNSNDIQKWDAVVKSFDDWDIYYLAEYAKSFELHGDGAPLLIHYADTDSEICYVVMKEDIANLNCFSNLLDREQFFDFTTPYGYGGALVKGDLKNFSVEHFKTELFEYCNDTHVVSQFIRFHPLLNNHNVLKDLCETRYIHDTIYIDLSTPETIWNNMDSKNRNVIRKAIANNIKIEQHPLSNVADFITIYNETMQRDCASDYYYFSTDFFTSLNNLHSNGCIFYALYENKPIASIIILFNDQYMHYHLSGTLNDYRCLGSNNLLLYEAALWGCAKGLKKFHLGGGMADNDGLFSFKKKFNKNGRLPFMIGRTIFNQKNYEYLKTLRSCERTFDPNNNFLIQYRQ